MRTAPSGLLTELLRDVSRSFYLTLRVLPGGIRQQVGLAYLLARATDTIADTEVIAQERRLGALEQLRGRILGETTIPLALGDLAREQGKPAERILLERCEEALQVLEGFGAGDQKLVREVLTVITSGQALDLERFAGADGQNIFCLQNETELEDYTYRVAGCVGRFWTQISRAHLFAQARINDDLLLEKGVKFGQGLQLVNILRDLPRDLRQGRCYLPRQRLAEVGLEPADLLDPAAEIRLRPLFNAYLDKAQRDLADGWDYTNLLPRAQVRLRLACAWPVLLGVKTLSLLRAQPVLDPGRRVKVSRGEVRQILLHSLLAYPRRAAWQRQFGTLANAVDSTRTFL